MSTLSDEERKALLTIARTAIEAELLRDSDVEYPDVLTEKMQEKRGCFVSLHKAGVLRGCIGIIEPTLPLANGVEDYACKSAFQDPRFPSLTQHELADVDIEVSVLTVPKALPFTDGEDLMRKLRPGIHGVILTQGWQSATFLPQVWEQLPKVETFLEHLCQKGGMGKDCWQDTATVVKTYEAEYFSE